MCFNYLFIEQPYKYRDTQTPPQTNDTSVQPHEDTQKPNYILEPTPTKPTIEIQPLLDTIKIQQPDESCLIGQLLINAKSEGFSIKKFDYKQTFNSYFIWLTKIDDLETNIYIYGQKNRVTSLNFTTLGDIFVQPTPIEINQRLHYLVELYEKITEETLATESEPYIEQLLLELEINSDNPRIETRIAARPTTFSVENTKTTGITISFPEDNPEIALTLAESRPYHDFPTKYLPFLEYLLAHDYKEDNLGYTSSEGELHRLILKGASQLNSTLYYKNFVYTAAPDTQDTLEITYQIRDPEQKNSILLQTQLASLLVSDINDLATQINPSTTKQVNLEWFPYVNPTESKEQPVAISNDEDGYSVTIILHGIANSKEE